MKTPFDAIRLQQPKVLRDQIREAVRELVVSGKLSPGEKIPSTSDLAKTWGTDVRTVHAALTTLEKEGLLARFSGKGTFVRQRETRLTCVGIYYTEDIWTGGSEFLRTVHAALRKQLAQVGVRTRAWIDPRPGAENGRPWPELGRAAENREIQGLISVGGGGPHLRWQNKLPIPSAHLTSASIPNKVGFEFRQLAELGLRALAAQGCRSVGLICPGSPTPPPGETGLNLYGEFVEHFLGLAHDLGLTVRSKWMRLPAREDSLVGRSQESYGYDCFREIWGQAERPAGLMAFPDTVARGMILAARDMQARVPADLKLVLHKNEMIELLCPMPATLLVTSEREIARALIQQVQKQFRGEQCEPVLVPFRLVTHRGNSPQPTTKPQEGSQS